MTPIDADAFLAEALAHGVGVDPQYAQAWPRDLSFGSESVARRYWVPSDYPGSPALLIAAMLECLDGWDHVVLWPRYAPLEEVLRDADIDELARLADAFPALGSHGGVRFERAEVSALVALVEVLVQHGWNPKTDVYIVPDSFDAVLMVDHHDAIHAAFGSEQRCARYEEAMAARGFPLGDDPADWTFKRKPDGTV